MAEIITYTETVGVVEVRDADGALVTVLEPTADVIQVVSPDLVGPQGPQGDRGPQGIQGEKGEQGPYAPQFMQTFAVPSRTWVIHHGLNSYPVVNTFDLYGFEISGDTVMPDRNTVVVTFEVPIAGTARLKA